MGGASMTENKNKFLAEALYNLSSDAEWELQDGKIKQWFKGERPTEAEIDAEIIRLQAEYDATQYQRDREAEYPSVQELVVALYDTDDKSAIEAKRAEVKKKYPKPS